MLASVVCAMLQGARGYSAFTQWIHNQDVDLWHVLGFTRRPPQLGAFRELPMALSLIHLERVLADWAKYCLGVSTDVSLEAVALDGKTLCGTLQPHERAVHLLALLDQRTGCVLSQSRVDAKTNEHKGALELLKTLVAWPLGHRKPHPLRSGRNIRRRRLPISQGQCPAKSGSLTQCHCFHVSPAGPSHHRCCTACFYLENSANTHYARYCEKMKSPALSPSTVQE